MFPTSISINIVPSLQNSPSSFLARPMMIRHPVWADPKITNMACRSLGAVHLMPCLRSVITESALEPWTFVTPPSRRPTRRSALLLKQWPLPPPTSLSRHRTGAESIDNGSKVVLPRQPHFERGKIQSLAHFHSEDEASMYQEQNVHKNIYVCLAVGRHFCEVCYAPSKRISAQAQCISTM